MCHQASFIWCWYWAQSYMHCSWTLYQMSYILSQYFILIEKVQLNTYEIFYKEIVWVPFLLAGTNTWRKEFKDRQLWILFRFVLFCFSFCFDFPLCFGFGFWFYATIHKGMKPLLPKKIHICIQKCICQIILYLLTKTKKINCHWSR